MAGSSHPGWRRASAMCKNPPCGLSHNLYHNPIASRYDKPGQTSWDWSLSANTSTFDKPQFLTPTLHNLSGSRRELLELAVGCAFN